MHSHVKIWGLGRFIFFGGGGGEGGLFVDIQEGSAKEGVSRF